MIVTELLHSFNKWTGMCRCGEGPFVTAEWLAHYYAQDLPHLTYVVPPLQRAVEKVAELAAEDLGRTLFGEQMLRAIAESA